MHDCNKFKTSMEKVQYFCQDHCRQLFVYTPGLCKENVLVIYFHVPSVCLQNSFWQCGDYKTIFLDQRLCYSPARASGFFTSREQTFYFLESDFVWVLTCFFLHVTYSNMIFFTIAELFRGLGKWCARIGFLLYPSQRWSFPQAVLRPDFWSRLGLDSGDVPDPGQKKQKICAKGLSCGLSKECRNSKLGSLQTPSKQNDGTEVSFNTLESNV